MRERISPALAFARRDLQVALSYRVPFLFDVVGAIFVVFEFYFLSKLIPATGSTGDYFAFVATGLVVTTFLVSGANLISSNTRQEQVQGTLEVTVSAGVRLPTYSLGISLYPLLAGGVRAAIYGTLAAVLGARLPSANWGLAVCALVLGSVSFVGIGLIAVGLVLVFRQASGAIAWLLGAATLLAGMVFPLDLLPDWLRAIAALSPATWTLQVAREALLEGAAWSDTWSSLAILCVMGVTYSVIAVIAVWWGLRRAIKTGGLSQY